MIRIWGQPKYAATTRKLAGYELFLREKGEGDDDWRLPSDFGKFAPAQLAALILATLAAQPDDLQLVSFNLDQAQFVDPAYCDLMQDVQAKLHYALVIELTERHGTGDATITLAMLAAAAKRYSEAGLRVCLDDVGTGLNQPGLVQALDPFVTEYKYALQNVRGKQSLAQTAAEASLWRNRAQRLHKMFALEGLEVAEDVALIEAFSPDLVQGYYFGRPHTMPIAADFGEA